MEPQKLTLSTGKNNKYRIIYGMSVTKGSILQKAVLLPLASESPGESGKGADGWACRRPTESEALGTASGSLHFLQVPRASLGHVKV